ncbi:MAG: hypothetical protein AAFP86_05985 [Planctomycetota bacterium]
MTQRAGELRRVALSGAPEGRPVAVTATVTVLHEMTADDAIDALYVELFAPSGGDIHGELIVQPASTSAADVDAAAVPFVAYEGDQRLILDGYGVRKLAGVAYQLGIRTTSPAGDTGLRVLGYAVRHLVSAVTP